MYCDLIFCSTLTSVKFSIKVSCLYERRLLAYFEELFFLKYLRDCQCTIYGYVNLTFQKALWKFSRDCNGCKYCQNANFPNFCLASQLSLKMCPLETLVRSFLNKEHFAENEPKFILDEMPPKFPKAIVFMRAKFL